MSVFSLWGTDGKTRILYAKNIQDFMQATRTVELPNSVVTGMYEILHTERERKARKLLV